MEKTMKLCLFEVSSGHLEAVRQLGEEMGRHQTGFALGNSATGLMGAACRGLHREHRGQP